MEKITENYTYEGQELDIITYPDSILTTVASEVQSD